MRTDNFIVNRVRLGLDSHSIFSRLAHRRLTAKEPRPMSQHVAVATDATFQSELVEAKGLVLVDFWAEWCGPCKTMMPAVEEIARAYAGEVRVAKVNSDENKIASEQFKVRGLPTLIVLRDGVEQERILGVTSKTRIAAVLDKYLEV